jgi:HEAT repeat protein/beta-lactamase regulating signal transducer with metallopeptidase domain
MPFSDILSTLPAGAAWIQAADAVAKATVLLAVAALASLALRRASAASRHLVWTLALVGALLLPILSLALPRWQLPLVTLASSVMPAAAAPAGAPDETPVAESSLAGAAAPLSAAVSASRADAAPAAAPGWLSGISWASALLLVWAAGAVLVLGRLALGIVAVQWMARRTERVTDAPWLPLARRLAAELGITPRILFLRSGRAAMPMAWGVLLPSVLMPADADAWPEERLRIVLLHELAHVKRRDCLTHMVAQVALALYWFNPLAWMAARHVRTERERACDDLVLAAGTRGPDYADQLLEIARAMRAGRYPGVLAGASLAMANRSQLEGRLMAILDPTVPRAGVTRLRTAGATAVVAIALVPLASLQPWAHAATPMAGGQAIEAGKQAGQAPMPTPMPTPVPAPGDVAAISGRVVPDAVEGTVRGTLDSGVKDLLRGALRGGIEGALEGALAGIDVNPRINVNPRVRIDQDVADGGRQAAATADPRAIAALTGALKDSDKDVREAALNALVQMRHPGIYEPLVQALSDASPDMRERAAFGLGQLRDRRAVGPLTGAVTDADAEVRQQAVFALGQLRDRSAAPALTAALKDQVADVRQQAVFALGQMRDPASFDGLVVALRDTNADVRQQAAFALGQLRDRRAVEPLISSLKDADADVRQQAAFGLGQLRDRAAVEALVIAMKDSAADVRQQAAFALGQMRDPRAIDALTGALKDASADVRQQAAFALGQIAR